MHGVWRFGRVSSCLDVAFMLASKGLLAEWQSVTALFQYAGRGQMRRPWQSYPGNLHAAMRLPMTDDFANISASVLLGYLCVSSLRKQGWPVLLKWPNDLVVIDHDAPKKIGGILLEERKPFLVAGIGINVFFSPDDGHLRQDAAMPATSLSTVQTSPDIKAPIAELIWERLVNDVHSKYDDISQTHCDWLALAENACLWLGERVELDIGDRCVCGKFSRLAKDGSLCLSIDGKHENFLHGSLRASV